MRLILAKPTKTEIVIVAKNITKAIPQCFFTLQTKKQHVYDNYNYIPDVSRANE